MITESLKETCINNLFNTCNHNTVCLAFMYLTCLHVFEVSPWDFIFYCFDFSFVQLRNCELFLCLLLPEFSFIESESTGNLESEKRKF